jgi:hypothetical protein
VNRVVEVHGFSKKERIAALMKKVVEENTRKARAPREARDESGPGPTA